MEALGFEVSEAENGEHALDVCEEKLPDAILLDSHMPNMNGYDFLRALRGRPGGERPTVVFCVAEISLADIARAFYAGTSECVAKPLDRETVEMAFRKCGLI